MKVFFSIYTEFVNLQIENFKEADFRTLFTLIDSSKRSLLNPEFSYHEYREYWIIRVENFYKNEIQYNSINFKSPVLKSFYQKFIFILMKISRMLEIKFIIDENFKDSIKKPNHSFIRKKQMLDLDLNDLQQISQNLNKEEEDDVSQRLHDFLIQKVNYWLTISSNEIQPQEQPFLICKICLKLQPLESMKGHSYSCKELAELGKDLMDLKREFNKAEIYAKELSRKLFMEIQLDRFFIKYY